MSVKRVGILTGGGDCPGLNAVIRAIVRKGIMAYDYEDDGGAGGMARDARRVGNASGFERCFGGFCRAEVQFWGRRGQIRIKMVQMAARSCERGWRTWGWTR